MNDKDGPGGTSKPQDDAPGINPQNFGQFKFTNPGGRGQTGALAGAAGCGLGPMTEIDFDFNILANYLAEEVQYGERW